MKVTDFVKVTVVTTALTILAAGATTAGPVIIAGTDSDDHGSATGAGANQGGWLFMQKALDNVGMNVTNGNKVVVDLGTTGNKAGTAITSAFNGSGLASSGWTLVTLNGTSSIYTFFAGTGAYNVNNTGLIYLDSGDNVAGGITAAESMAVSANASILNNFVGAGGGLFSQANPETFLPALVPGFTRTDETTGGVGTPLTLTAAGQAAFPGLTNADLSTGPWHAYFGGNLGGLDVLATAPDNTGQIRPVIVGNRGNGSLTQSPGVPEPSSLTVFAVGLGSLALIGVRRRVKAA